jgi:radical SAM protein with 4Fe4S-binding SPASM domain
MMLKSMTPFETLGILQREGLRPPQTLTLAITGACNLVCRHCWVEAGGAASAGNIPTPTVRRLIEEFAALGGESIRFTGGEPLCHPGWLEFMQYARSIDFGCILIQTNGMLFKDEQIAALREMDFPGLAIQISLDGATAKTPDLVRGKGAFRMAMDGIRRLVQAGLGRRLTIFFTEMRHNLEEIPAVLELAGALGIASVVAGSLVVCGRAAEESLVAPPDPDQYLRLLDRYDAEPRFRELYGKIGKVAALEWRNEADPRTECCTFVANPYLTPGGRLYPCVLCHTKDFAVSGLFEKNLADAFSEGAPLWSALLRTSRCRSGALKECRDCPGRLVCASGCMGRAWGSRGDLMATDDRCASRQTIYRLKAAS